MTDRLTPPQLPAWALEDLSRFFTRDAEVHRQLLVTARMRSEAARREAEAKPVNVAQSVMGKAIGCEREGPGSAAASINVGPGTPPADDMERNADAVINCLREDKPAPAADDLLALLEGLAMGLEQQEEKSAALRVRQGVSRIKELTARADRLAAAIRDIDRACNMAEVHRIAVDALASEGGDRG